MFYCIPLAPRQEIGVSGRHFASWLWRGLPDDPSRPGPIAQISKAGIKVIQAAQGSESAIQTERISHSSTYDPPMLGTTASALTHEGQAAKDRNELDMLQAKIISESRD